MKYKHAESQGFYYKIDDLGNKSSSFNEGKPKTSSAGMFKEMQEWLKIKGNSIEPQFTPEELAEKEADNIEAAKTTYIGLRLSEYPSIGDQLDYIYHNGIAAWKTDMIKPVKDKYPKP